MILLYNTLENYYLQYNESSYVSLRTNKQKSYHQLSSNKLKYQKFAPILISKFNRYLYKSCNKLIKINTNDKFIIRNLWNKFINQYWQETIFISTTNSLSDNYINKLKISGLSIYKDDDYKKFLLEFSKSLINGKIYVDIKNSIDDKHFVLNSPLIIHNKDIYVKYIWRKGFNWHISLLYSKYLLTKNSLLTNANHIKTQNIEFNSLPIFTITNQSNQIIMSESSEQILLQKDFLCSLSQYYRKYLGNNSYIKKSYVGLLFIDPDDAREYKEYIEYNHRQSNKNSKLNFFISHLTLYRKLVSNKLYNTEFRLIPDLKEVSDLLNKYQYYCNVSFHKKQFYGKKYFQGQPVYVIQPLLIKNKNTNKKELVDYCYFLPQKNQSIKCTPLFMNYQTAVNAWNKFRDEYSYYGLPKKPSLNVSSLENFFKDFKTHNNNTNIIFIPSTQAYKAVKQQKQIKNSVHITEVFINKSIYVKKIVEKIIWSLTSRQPINW
uniref:Uncharacterized protein n=1 Tax=Nitophyllum punctatum TaxID=158729 RepID=A0A4D6WY00_9FLOR|nr:hypothetical protein [Nitophyllum punctatum]